ncbi:hypothetical protein LCGC14_1479170 [marine sediment metagenome]|uniref:Hedgehog/Intein (Hint) domain-containing protein n=1 Tax=marine sediment metagenome TaxID=412755 RepID=A0A0F9JA18_9ZZZZ
MPFKDIALGGAVNPKQPSRFQPTLVPRETSVGPRLKRLEGFNAKFIRRGGIPVLELPARSVFSTYNITGGAISATDAGSDATVNVPTKRIFWPDKVDGVQYRPFSLTGLAYSTSFQVYIDNPERNGIEANHGAIPTSAAPEDILVRQDTRGRIYLGLITTPAALGGDTSGSGGGGGTGGDIPGGCVLEGTTIFPFSGDPIIKESEQEEWVEIKLADGRVLIATPKHPVYSDAGKTPLNLISCGEEIITDKGMVAVVEKQTIQNKAIKLAVYIPTGHLYWANGILSHNLKIL